MFLFGLLVFAVGGCSGGGTESVEKFDGVTVTVRFPQGKGMHSDARYVDGVQTWKAGDLEYVVDHLKLSVNGKSAAAHSSPGTRF